MFIFWDHLIAYLAEMIQSPKDWEKVCPGSVKGPQMFSKYVQPLWQVLSDGAGDPPVLS